MKYLPAKKHLGQNFLSNPVILRAIVWTDNLEKENILEIGPGPGDLTAAILQQKPASFTAVEIDRDMFPILQSRFEKSPIVIYHQDFLKIDIQERALATPPEKPIIKEDSLIEFPHYRAYGNIPYYITSPILFHLFYGVTLSPEVAILTMQKEVADRILARDGKHSVLSLTCQLVTDIIKVCDIHPNNFIPAPKVWSTCLRFTLKKYSHRKNATQILWIVKKWFAQKRKKLISNLEQWGYNKKSLQQIFQSLKIDENLRAEDLSVTEWENLSREILK